MKLEHNGIHKNIGFVIQHCGGYDREYHIMKLSEELNIDITTMTVLCSEASNKNLGQYIDLLRNGMSIEKVFSMVDEDNRIIHAKFNSTMSMMGALIRESDLNFKY